MNGCQQCVSRERRVSRDAEQRSAVLGRPQPIGVPVKLPEPDIGGGGSKGHPLFAR